MIDINLLRKDPEFFKNVCSSKKINPDTVDAVLKFDEERRTLIGQSEKLRATRNEITEKMKSARDEKLVEQAKDIKKQLQDIEPQLKKAEENLDEMVRRIPNPPRPDVKSGKDESENEVLRKFGEPTKFDFAPKDHVELGEALDIIDIKRATKVSGARFYYLKGDGALLEWALHQFAKDTLVKEHFIPVVPPVLIKRESMAGMGYLEHGGEEDMFTLDKDGLILVGTSEQSIGAMHMGETFDAQQLPIRYMGFSTCFRREAGSYGKDTKGILRVHQFDKVEMFSITTPEKSDAEHDYLLSLEEKLFQALEIPYQLIKMCTGDLGAPAARKYDIEAWMPSQNKYREVTSTSTTTDFQSRRLNIKYKAEGKTEYVHMLNGTAFSMTRPIIAIMENFQQKDGSIKVPKVLQKYMNKEVIK